MPKDTKKNRKSNREISFRSQDLIVVNPTAAGLDLHKERIWACAPPSADGSRPPVRSFGTYTVDLDDMCAWLTEKGVKTVAMEATGVFWWPVVERLKAGGFEVLLVNAKEIKGVKGKPKTDKLDCEWIRRLHSYGLLKGSFLPDPDTEAMKSLWHHHETLVQESSRLVQRMQKCLLQMNFRLDVAVSDVMGVTGRKVIDALLDGERDPAKLAKHRDRRCKKSEEEIAKALNGNARDELLYILKDLVSAYDSVLGKIAGAEEQLKLLLAKLPSKGGVSPDAVDGARFKPFEELLSDALGVDLTELDGVGALTVVSFVVNAGRDMSPWPTGNHFVSWLCLSPNPNESGGKKKSGRTSKSSSPLAKAFRMAIMSIGKLDCPLGAFYRRLKSRIGPSKATTATARKLALIFYHAVKKGVLEAYHDARAYEETQRARTLHRCRRQLASLGFEIVPKTPQVAQA